MKAAEELDHNFEFLRLKIIRIIQRVMPHAESNRGGVVGERRTHGQPKQSYDVQSPCSV